LIRDCIGPQLAGRLLGFNVRLLEQPVDLVELGDWCSISLVVLWIDHSGMDFETAFEATLEAAPKRPIAILSDFADSGLVSRALSHGVRGYLSPSMSLAEIASAIRFVLEGGTFVPHRA
jgi:DNA-binding NarL/FixJ family response regulator